MSFFLCYVNSYFIHDFTAIGKVRTMILFMKHSRMHGRRLPRKVIVKMTCFHCLILARVGAVMFASVLFEVVGSKVFLCFEMHEHNLMMTYQ